MSDNQTPVITLDEAQASETAQPQQPLSFAQYKQKLKNEVEIAELRARVAKAYFEELAASNQYNQLRSMLMAKAQEAQSVSENTEAEVTGQEAPSTDPDQA